VLKIYVADFPLLHLNFVGPHVKLGKLVERMKPETNCKPPGSNQVVQMPQHSANYLKWFFVFASAWIVCIGCGKSERDSVAVPKMPDSFHFMDIGVNTVIDSDVRDRLVKTLDSYATDQKTIIDLDLKYKGFMKSYYPNLSALNQKLNVNDMVRKEYPATKLTFRHTRQKNSLFNYVELIYANDSGCPLLIKMIALREIPDLVKTVKEKYGMPHEIPIEQGSGFSLSWQRGADAFIIARFPGNYNQPEYHMMIVYANRLMQLIEREAEAEKKRKGKEAEKIF